MNVQEKLCEEFERVIILREKYRAALRQHHDVLAVEGGLKHQIMRNITALNELIVDTRAALSSNDAIEVLTMLHRLEAIEEE